jgi:glycosyltransferase involved in cell wall biosynthesis
MSRRRVLHVFNRYVFTGGEEKSTEAIESCLRESYDVERCFFESSDWTGPKAPSKLTQLIRTFYNHESRRRYEEMIRDFKPDVAVFHNTMPVGSPSLYHASLKIGLPVIHFVHNFRPFSVGGTLYLNGEFLPEALKGNYWREVFGGAWQRSIFKSAIMAVVLKFLHYSGWLRSVKSWVCISEFIREKFIEAGLPPEQLITLRHFCQMQSEESAFDDRAYYLFLSRLVEVKGVEVLLNTWQRLEEILGPKTPELWIGGEGPLEPMVVAAAARSSKIKFLGLISGSQKIEVIRGCRAMLAPSIWWEPLGLVTYEAYDSGKPMLAAASGGLCETIVDGVTGFLHEPGNANALMSDVLKIESMSLEARAEMGANGRRWLKENAGIEKWKQEFDKIVESACAAK